MRTLSFKKRLVFLAGLLLLSACSPAPAIKAVDPTAGPQPLTSPDNSPTAVPARDKVILLGNPICKIKDFGKLGAPGFPSAIPQGGKLKLDCAGTQQNPTLDYDEEVFPETTFIMGNDGKDELPLIGQIGTDLREIPENDPTLNDCRMEAYSAPTGNGGPRYTSSIDLSTGQYVVTTMTTAGNTRSVYAEDRNSGVPGYPIHPQAIKGTTTGSQTYNIGFDAFALFEKETDELNSITGLLFKGILTPDQNCPVYILKSGN